MKGSIALAMVLLCLAGSTAAMADYCINKDFTNTGSTPAYDIAVVITGNSPPTWLYSGYVAYGTHPPTSISAGVFSSFTSFFQGANEVLHWQNLNGLNQPINAGKLVHVGWCTVAAYTIASVYWTDASGNPLASGGISETASHWANSATPGVQWDNPLLTSISVANASFAVLSAPLALADLNGGNTQLISELQPLPGGTFQIAPGGSVTLPVSGTVPGQWLVLVYGVNGPSSAATTTDYVQFQIPQPQ
jgi:hypothetical protein